MSYSKQSGKKKPRAGRARSGDTAARRPAIGSPEYFIRMPADQARRELVILYGDHQTLERKYFRLRSSVAAFKSLLDDCAGA